MAAQTVLNAVSSNSASSAVDVTGAFTVSTIGLPTGATVAIQIADTDTEARYNLCGPKGVIVDQTVVTFQVEGAWKVRAKPSGLVASSALTVIVNQ